MGASSISRASVVPLNSRASRCRRSPQQPVYDTLASCALLFALHCSCSTRCKGADNMEKATSQT